MFTKPEIAERLSKFVLVRLWINDPDPGSRSPEWHRMLQQRFGTSSIPLYVVLTPENVFRGKLNFPGGTADSFAGAMKVWLDAMLR